MDQGMVIQAKLEKKYFGAKLSMLLCNSMKNVMEATKTLEKKQREKNLDLFCLFKAIPYGRKGSYNVYGYK